MKVLHVAHRRRPAPGAALGAAQHALGMGGNERFRQGGNIAINQARVCWQQASWKGFCRVFRSVVKSNNEELMHTKYLWNILMISHPPDGCLENEAKAWDSWSFSE